MKLINFDIESSLNNLRRIMKAEHINYFHNKNWFSIKINEINFKIEKGNLIVEDLGELKICSNATIEFNNKKVLVYIPGGRNYKFHFANCPTLYSMKYYGYYDRYILTRRTDGYFKIFNSYGWEEVVKLNACKNCLKKLGYSTSDYNARNFDIQEFFSKFEDGVQGFDKPTYSDTNYRK